jgi:hypothetical protein
MNWIATSQEKFFGYAIFLCPTPSSMHGIQEEMWWLYMRRKVE